MTDYTTDQLKDLLLHIVAEGVEKQPAPGENNLFNLLAPRNIAAALTACGIPAENPTHRLLVSRPATDDQPQRASEARDFPDCVEAAGLIFHPRTSVFSTWDNLRQSPKLLAYQEQKQALGLVCEWGIIPTVQLASEHHVQTLVDIIKPWQAQVQHSAITKELPLVEPPRPNPFGKKM